MKTKKDSIVMAPMSVIENITTDTFELDFSGVSHFCNGDSGSGIYEKNSNNIVGVVSSYITPLGTKGCDNAIAFIATRLDANETFINQNTSTQNTPTPTTAQIPTTTQTPPTATPTLEPIETVPDDYLKDYYPEAVNPDGTFDLEAEILFQIQELDRLFAEIYPEEVASGTPAYPTDTYESSPTPMSDSSPTPYSYDEDPTPTEAVTSEADEDDNNNTMGMLIILGIGGIACR